MSKRKPGGVSSNTQTPNKFMLNEDWLAVIIAFGLIILSALKILGENGIPIRF